MASRLDSLLLFSLFFLASSASLHKPNLQQNAMLLKVIKDPSTLQYLTYIHKGTSVAPTKLVVDLGGPFLWESCHVSSSHRLVDSISLHCSIAKPNSNDKCFSKTCDVPIVNSITRFAIHGKLAEDILAVDRTGLSLVSISTVENFLFVCAPPLLLNGLASGAKGILGLGKTRLALPSQIFTNRNFFVCISSSDGFIFSGEGDPKISLSYTPLITNRIGAPADYYINLRSIKVNDRRISINPILLSRAIKLSTVIPYTTMESSIYNTFTSAYVSAATSMNMTSVAPRPPFGTCFSLGPKVPVIDFVLQSEMVLWRFSKRNSMVHVGDDVMCLGFLDGGVGFSDGVVIGGYQLEDHLLEFDLGTSMLGFSSSLLMKQTSCSDFKVHSKDSG